jgi:hypothetical protein
MAKVPADETMRSQRGQQYDVVKPVDWQRPEPELLSIIGIQQHKANLT